MKVQNHRKMSKDVLLNNAHNREKNLKRLESCVDTNHDGGDV